MLAKTRIHSIATGEYVLLLCFSSPDDIIELQDALNLWRDLRLGGELSDAWVNTFDAIDTLLAGDDSPCLEVSGNNFNCTTFDTFNDVFDFYPNDPFTANTDDNPQLALEWLRYGDILELEVLPDWLQQIVDFVGLDFAGYERDDCILVPNLINPLNPIQAIDDISDTFTNFPLPTVTMQFEGQGTVGLELLNVPLGGRAIVLRDIDITLQEIHELLTDAISEGNEGILLSVAIIELNRDVTSLPPELASTQIQEFTFTETDQNTLRIIFFPAFDDTPPFLFPFGGIRSVRVCEGISIKSVKTGNTASRFDLREGVIMATFDEMYNAHLKALNDHATLKSKSWLFGADDDGLGLDPESIKGTLTLDASDDSLKKASGVSGGFGGKIPAGVNDVNLAYGGNVEQANGFWGFFLQIHNGLDNSLNTAIVDAGIKASFGLAGQDVPDFQALIHTYRTQAQNTVNRIAIDTVLLAKEIFFSEPVQGIYNFAANTFGNNLDNYNLFTGVANQVPDEQFDKWFGIGQNYKNDPRYVDSTPRVGYVLGSEIDDGYNGGARLGGFPTNRRILLKVTGRINRTTDPNQTYDGYYHIDANGVVNYRPIQISASSGNASDPDAQPKRITIENGEHVVTYTTGIADRINIPDFFNGEWEGQLDISSIDLGAK